MTGEPPAVSVIVPCYNAAAYIVGALDSILAQDHTIGCLDADDLWAKWSLGRVERLAADFCLDGGSGRVEAFVSEDADVAMARIGDIVSRQRIHYTNTVTPDKARQSGYLRILKASLDQRRRAGVSSAG